MIKRRSNFSLTIPSGLSNSEIVETTSTFDAVGRIFEEEGGSKGGFMPDAIPFQVGMRWALEALSFLFFPDAVESWI